MRIVRVSVLIRPMTLELCEEGGSQLKPLVTCLWSGLTKRWLLVYKVFQFNEILTFGSRPEDTSPVAENSQTDSANLGEMTITSAAKLLWSNTFNRSGAADRSSSNRTASSYQNLG